ncbi:MAG TPA: hypothetical protein GX401_00490 [Clostridiales bacterium]|nr:hypothetical protein [Clostridiales bacterium]
MQDMLTKIVDMDEKARQLTEEAERAKVASQQEIEASSAKIHDEYLERARKRIQINQVLERDAAENQWLKTKAGQEKAAQAMDELYCQKGQQWIDSIVQNVINS